MTKLKKLKEYDGRYEVCEDGKIYNTNFAGTGKRKEISQYLTNGYPSVSVVTNKGDRKTVYVHRLLAQYFLGGVPEGHEVNHIDGNPTNNALSNLEVITHAENIQHAVHKLDKNTSIPKSAVIAVNMETGETTIYPSANAAVKDGFLQASISKCCLGKRNSHKGYRWAYADPNHLDRNRAKHLKEKKAVESRHIQTGKTKYYDSVNATADDGFLPPAVSKCCRKLQHEHKGYTWRYVKGRGRRTAAPSNQRAVQGYNPLTKELVKFDSVAEAARNGFEPTAIVKCCRGQQQSSHGFQWTYL
jgi:hypothetical protein